MWEGAFIDDMQPFVNFAPIMLSDEVTVEGVNNKAFKNADGTVGTVRRPDLLLDVLSNQSQHRAICADLECDEYMHTRQGYCPEDTHVRHVTLQG